MWLYRLYATVHVSIFQQHNLPFAHIRCILIAGLWSRSRHLGLETVSRHTNVSSQSRLEKNCQRLGLGHLHLVPKTNFRPNCAGHSTQYERALDVVIAVVTIAHHINTLETMNVKN